MKRKESKFKNFIKKVWSASKKPLMILSVVFNLLMILIIIIGCSKNKKTMSVSALTNEDIGTLAQTSWRINEPINDFSIFSDDGNTFFVKYYANYNLSPGTLYVSLTFTRTTTPEGPAGIYAYNISGNYITDGGVQRTHYFYLRNNAAHETFMANEFEFQGYFLNNEYENETLMSWFVNNATLLNDFKPTTFKFNDTLNYNAPYAMNIDSMFVNQYWEDVQTLGVDKIYDFPYFTSNGQLFNRIRLYYFNANGTQYKKDDGTFTINTNTNTAYYFFMQYINTDNDYRIEVNNRQFEVGFVSATSGTQTYLVKGSYWVNEEYKSLHFRDALTPEQRNHLAQFNSASNITGFVGSTDEVGLGNTFALISQGFGGLTNIFKIQLLPNITIGLLLFLPLVVTIIIVIIKLVKR